MTPQNEESAQISSGGLSSPHATSLPGNSPLLRPSIPPQDEQPSRRALLVMAKQPIAGNAKTRLVPPLTSAAAATLYHCFLQDILATVRAAARDVPFTPVIAYTPAAAQDFFRRLAPDFWLISQKSPARATAPDPPAAGAPPAPNPRPAPAAPQPEPPVHQSERLGDRLQFVLSAALDHGFRQVAAINSDSPTLPPRLFSSAFQSLDDPHIDAVFGPCADGGYYLIGVENPPGRLVTDVQMSTPTVLRDTLAIADEEGTRIDLLPEWYDVDSARDLDRLTAELASHPERAPATVRFLATAWTSMSSSQP